MIEIERNKHWIHWNKPKTSQNILLLWKPGPCLFLEYRPMISVSAHLQKQLLEKKPSAHWAFLGSKRKNLQLLHLLDFLQQERAHLSSRSFLLPSSAWRFGDNQPSKQPANQPTKRRNGETQETKQRTPLGSFAAFNLNNYWAQKETGMARTPQKNNSQIHPKTLWKEGHYSTFSCFFLSLQSPDTPGYRPTHSATFWPCIFGSTARNHKYQCLSSARKRREMARSGHCGVVKERKRPQEIKKVSLRLRKIPQEIYFEGFKRSTVFRPFSINVDHFENLFQAAPWALVPHGHCGWPGRAPGAPAVGWLWGCCGE